VDLRSQGEPPKLPRVGDCGQRPREAALQWAARIVVACRCGQEVRDFINEAVKVAVV